MPKTLTIVLVAAGVAGSGVAALCVAGLIKASQLTASQPTQAIVNTPQITSQSNVKNVSPSPVPSTPSSPSLTVEQMLARLDNNQGNESDYAALLDKMEPRCLEDRKKIGGFAYGATKALAKDGKTYSTLSTLRQAVYVTEPLEGKGQTPCADYFAVIAATLGKQ